MAHTDSSLEIEKLKQEYDLESTLSKDHERRIADLESRVHNLENVAPAEPPPEHSPLPDGNTGVE